MLYALLAVTALALAVYGVLDVLRTPAEAVRVLPKPLWVLVCLLPLVGAGAWLLTGRAPTPPARPVAPPRPPDDDEEFLRQLRRRAEEQRRRAGEQEPPEPA